MKIVHPECRPDCAHHTGRDTGILVQAPASVDRMTFEDALMAQHEGRVIEYLGIFSPEHPVHVWRIGADPWQPMRAAPEADAGTPARKSSVIHRRELWAGDGPPGPVDFSRPAEVVPEPFPAPMITSAQPELAPDAPAPVADLARYAAALGWDHMLQYAVGWVPHARLGTPSVNPKTSWSIRFKRGPERAVAVRMDGSWSSLWTWSSARFFTPYKGVTEFKEAIR